MYREDRFVMSHRPYAVDLFSLRVRHVIGDYAVWEVDAVWFRGRKGVTAACVGILSHHHDGTPANGRAFLEDYEDGRYGGRCLARWDGTGVWHAGQDPEKNARHLELLRTVLNAYHANPKAPDLGERWDYWWRF